MYRYERPLNKSEVFVALLNESNFPVYTGLEKLIEDASDKYSFTFKSFTSKDACLHEENLDKYLLRHVIILTDRDTLRESADYYSPLLQQYRTMSLAPIYKTDKKFQEEGNKVEDLKKEFLGKINFLRPNSLSEKGEVYPSIQKIVDNSICDTVRIKYKPVKIEKDISSLVEDHALFFSSASKVYSDLKLFHRAPSDGFFALRVPEGFLITATKTDKSNFDPKRVSLVYGYDQETNTITYSGNYLPSSDVVEASIVFARCPQIHSLIHTHASERFTRNPEFAHKIAIPQMSYGESELGIALAKIIPSHVNDFVIMEDHGELFAAGELAELDLSAKLVTKICNEAELAVAN